MAVAEEEQKPPLRGSITTWDRESRRCVSSRSDGRRWRALPVLSMKRAITSHVRAVVRAARTPPTGRPCITWDEGTRGCRRRIDWRGIERRPVAALALEHDVLTADLEPGQGDVVVVQRAPAAGCLAARRRVATPFRLLQTC